MGLAATFAARLSDLVSNRTRRPDRRDVASRRDPGMDHPPAAGALAGQDPRLATVQAIRRLSDASATLAHAREWGERIEMNPRSDLALCLSGTPLFDAAAPTEASPQALPALPAGHDRDRRSDRLEGPAEFAIAYESPSSIPLGAIDLLDHEVFNAVIARALQSRRNDDGSVDLVLHLANCRDDLLSLRLRLRLLRADGTLIELPSPWYRLTLDPHSLTTCRERSIDVRDASHYIIEIDRDRRIG